MPRRHSSCVVIALAGSLLLVSALPALAQKSRPIEVFTAFAAALGTGRTNIVEISVNRWSTDEERDRLLTTLQEFGQDKLLDTLQKIRPPVGYMRTPSSIGYDLYYGRNHPQPDGGRRVVFATNRRVSFREAANNARSMDYQFTLIELRLGPDGKGEGKLVPAAKVAWDHDAHRIEIENYAALPVDLIQVTAKKP
jgi:hypothetical protein